MEIACIFADKYRNLYSSVPTSVHEITDLRNELHSEIINADPSEHAAVLTVMDVCKSLSTLKHEKSDGLRGTDSDHFIYSSRLFKIYITLMVNSMFTHEYTPSSLIESVINSIPKDLRGDMCNKDNYRGIALCSALCKLVDILRSGRDSFPTVGRRFQDEKGSRVGERFKTTLPNLIVHSVLTYYVDVVCPRSVLRELQWMAITSALWEPPKERLADGWQAFSHPQTTGGSLIALSVNGR